MATLTLLPPLPGEDALAPAYPEAVMEIAGAMHDYGIRPADLSRSPALRSAFGGALARVSAARGAP